MPVRRTLTGYKIPGSDTVFRNKRAAEAALNAQRRGKRLRSDARTEERAKKRRSTAKRGENQK
jgi:hypothetical protein